MINRFKNFIMWFCITFVASLAILAVLPLGHNGESTLEFGFPAVYWIAVGVTIWTNLIHLVNPKNA